MKHSSTQGDIISVSLVILVLFLILIFMQLLSPNQEISEKHTLSQQEIKILANQSLDVVKMLARGAEIGDGPRLIDASDINNMPSLYKGLEGQIYMLHLISSNKELYIVMNNTQIIKTVPLTSFG